MKISIRSVETTNNLFIKHLFFEDILQALLLYLIQTEVLMFLHFEFELNIDFMATFEIIILTKNTNLITGNLVVKNGICAFLACRFFHGVQVRELPLRAFPAAFFRRPTSPPPQKTHRYTPTHTHTQTYAQD